MKHLKNFINLLLFGNIFISTGTLAITCATLIQFDISISTNKDYLGLIFCATLFIYNIQRYFYAPLKPNAKTSIRREWIANNQKIIKSLIIASIAGGVYFFFKQKNYNLFIYLSPLFAMSILYFSLAKLRKKPLTKLVTLTLVWVITTAVIPLIINNTSLLNIKATLHILERFCFILAICIPFDIRDLSTDIADNTITLPQTIGEKNALKTGLSLIATHTLIILTLYSFQLNNIIDTSGIIVSAIITAIILFKTNVHRNEYFYVFGIDGTLLLQGLILISTSYYTR